MSLFGNTQQPAGGGLFGATQPANQQSQVGGGLFGGQQQAQPSGGLLGGQQQNQQQVQGGGLFGGLSKPAQTTNPFGGLGSGTQQQQTGGGLLGGLGQSQQQNQQQQGGGLFGGLASSIQQSQQQPQTGGMFGSLLGGQNQQNAPGIFNQSTQQNIPQLGQSQLGNSLWQPNSGVNPREKSVLEQMQTVLAKWDTGGANCVFKHYFYNKVEPNTVPFYQPGPNEDPKAWEEAFSKKPGPSYIPVLCTGFQQLGERIKTQQRSLAGYNKRLHEINNSLSLMLQKHDTQTSIRAMDARRKHNVLRQRCLALATKVQVLRNRGYAMGGDEEDLKTKLQALERGVSDPGLGARGEEIWARMLTVQERARLLKAEIEKSGVDSPEGLDEDAERAAKQILEDYQTQLTHLKKELEAIQTDYVEWEKDQGPGPLQKKDGKLTKAEAERAEIPTSMRYKTSPMPLGFVPFS
ncbi:nucleoporin complex subunit 54-domain-containing protein [Tricladium varicosporioides]|nr:nucleoporin complex subunit 54-domain-containing protein [Hymenoscyphus varicosporioides]